MILRTKLVLILLLVSISLSVYATTKEECQVYITKGKSEALKKNYPTALEYFSKAEALAQNNNLPRELVEAKASIGSTFQKISNYSGALDYFKQALKILETEPGVEDKHIDLLYNIGNVYVELNDYKNALHYFNIAYPLARDKKLEDRLVLLAINISAIYNNNGNPHNARAYLEKVIDIPKSRELQQAWKKNYAESFFKEGKSGTAKEITEDLIKEIDHSQDNNCYICIAELIYKTSNEPEKLEMAIKYARKGIEKEQELSKKIMLYKQISKLYSKRGNYKMSLTYKDSVVTAGDSLTSLISETAFEVNKVKLHFQDYQNKILLNEEKHIFQRKIYILVIAFGIILIVAGYGAYQYRLRKARRERIILEDKKVIARLELDKVKNTISEKNNRIALKTHYITGRNELIQQIVASLESMPVISQNKKVSTLIKNLQNHIKWDEEWDDVIEHFEKVNPTFINTLKSRHPELSSNDIRFISYIYMGLGIKEISNIFNITYNASRIREKRILEKMGQDKDVSLSDYILKLD